jgi:PEP-CTERM motif
MGKSIINIPLLVAILLCYVGLQERARATIIPIGPGDFSASATLETYGTVQTLQPVDGKTFSGVLHNFTIGGVPSPLATIDDGPGNTNHITIANIEGPTTGILSLLFPQPENRLGYGYAVLSNFIVPNATTVELFDASHNILGSLSATGSPDPSFTGGFLGVESTIAFTSAQVSFLSGPAFAFDNLEFEPTAAAVPEPSSLILLVTSLLGCYWWRRNRQLHPGRNGRDR